MTSKTKIFKFAELFCGPGGLGLGAISSSVEDGKGRTYKIKSVWANDIDADTCNTYALNLHKGETKNIICSPVEKIDFSTIPKFDALAFGFPCNDFSVVGEQKGFNGKFGPLYTYGVKAIESHKPLWFIAENVGGLQSANSGKAFAKILEDLSLAGDGYTLTTHLYKFEDYGVPQTRHRIVIVGFRKDLNLIFKVPAPTTQGKHVTSKSAIDDPPIPPDAHNNEMTTQSMTVIERLSHIPPGENAWYEGIPKHLQLNVLKTRMSQIYKRLHPDRPAYTITGSGGGGTHGYHWNENRALTNRERARLQTFPDNFIFVGSKESVRKQIGMAVPPRGAQAIVTAILKTFAGLPYASVKPSIVNNNNQEKLFKAV